MVIMNTTKLAAFGILCAAGAAFIFAQKKPVEPQKVSTTPIKKVTQKNMNSKTLIVGGGCFWCVEAVLEDLIGVESVENGYAGGTVKNPTYEQVCGGDTMHAEVCKITFDPKKISEEDLLHVFFTAHDPTTLNAQGGDRGTQYRSVIFYRDAAEKALGQKIISEVDSEKIYNNKIVTTLEPLTDYYRAEEYHQDYYAKFEKATDAEKSRMNGGYCSYVVAPKVAKFRAKYAAKLKKKD
jgi:peptide-methionine (S)-S-oxide reductase